MSRKYLSALLMVILLATAGCASKNANLETNISSSNEISAQDDFFDFDDEDNAQTSISDPLEPWNRFWFAFNDFVLLKIVKPVHVVYADFMPEPIQGNLKNFKRNLGFPVRFLNSLLQGKFGQAGVEFGRFFINTTVGIGGLFDVAKKDKPLYPVDPFGADFGQTLATWGVGEGIYLVWPFLGPSNLRDSLGTGVDSVVLDPFNLVPVLDHSSFLGNQGTQNAITGTNVGLMFNNAKQYYLPYEQVTQAALEKYTAVRNAWVNNRRSRLSYTPK